MTERALRFAPSMRPIALLLLLSLAACRASSPPTPGPEARCADACKVRASGCSQDECTRGCRLLMDKLVEREGAQVLACVARESGAPHKRACDDMMFAGCAVLSGVHADGGPPGPPPKTDIDIAGEDDSKSSGDDDL
jgi:hypothetical protein